MAGLLWIGRLMTLPEPQVELSAAPDPTLELKLLPPAGPAPAPDVVRLGELKAGLLVDPEEAEAGIRELFLTSSAEAVRVEALELLIERGAAGWPEDHRGRFLRSIAHAAVFAGREYRIPPSVTMSQAAIESGWGRSKLARNHHNLFGIKASGGGVRMSTNKRQDDHPTPPTASYRRFDSVDEAILYHAQLVGRDRRYARAQQVWWDWRQFLGRLAPIYAAHPRYAQTVGGLIRKMNLDQWDGLLVEEVRRRDLLLEQGDAVADVESGRPVEQLRGR
jgi:hypothetical protein